MVSEHIDVCAPHPRGVCLQIMGVMCDIGAYTFEQAVRNGHFHIVQWLRELDPPCQWSVKAYVQAASKGHLRIIRWLREQDPPCPWGSQPQEEDIEGPLDPRYEETNTFSAAAKSHDLHIMRWLYEDGFPWKQQYGTQYMQAAAEQGDLKALDWARSQHPPFVMDETVCEASLWDSASSRAISVLRWLRT